MKHSLSLILFAMLAVAGCAKVPTPKPNLFSVPELAKTRPLLQDICTFAGSCENVLINCRHYDGTGNTDLRNNTVLEIGVLGYEISSTKFFDYKKPVGHAYRQDHGKRGPFEDFVLPREANYDALLDVAVRDFWRDWKTTTDGHGKEVEDVYPNSTPCDPTKECQP